MAENGSVQGPAVQQVLITSDGFKVDTKGNVPLHIVEVLLMRSLAYVQRELLVERLARHQALADETTPRLYLPDGPN